MKKKILSLALSVVLVMGLLPTMGLFPAMSVSAAGGQLTFADNFEAYDVAVYSDATEKAVTEMKIDGTTTWNVGKSAVAEIVEMTGYDGKTTKALKYMSRYAGSGEKIDTPYRLTAVPTGTHGASLAGKIFVQEVKVWIPEGYTTDTTDNELRPDTFFVGYGVYVKGNNIFVGQKNIDTGVEMPENQWVRFTVVLDYSNWAEAGDNIGYTMYMNDVCIAKGVDSNKKIVAASNSLNITTIGRKYAQNNADYLDDYFIIDDVNQYHSPDETTASSYLNGNDSVSATTSPTVNFTERVLEYAGHSDGVISAENNIDFEKSDGTKVKIEKLTLSADGKTLTIDPKADLEKNTQYTVTVKNLHDMYGRDIATYTFSFTTADEASVEYTKEPTFTNEQLLTPGGSTTPITKLETGYINTSFTVKNTHASKSQDVIALVFLKDNGEIKQFQFEKGNLAANGGELTFNGGFFVNVEQFVNPTIEVFVWDSLYGGMTPLVPKHTLTTTAIVK